MFRCRFVIFVIIFVAATNCCLAQDLSPSRKWRSSKGHEIEAALVGIDEKEITLRKASGETLDVEIDAFSQADRDYIKMKRKRERLKHSARAKSKAPDSDVPVSNQTANVEERTNRKSTGAQNKPEITEQEIKLLGKRHTVKDQFSINAPAAENHSWSSQSRTRNGYLTTMARWSTNDHPNDLMSIEVNNKDSLGRNRKIVLKYISGVMDEVIASKSRQKLEFEKFTTRGSVPDWVGTSGSSLDVNGNGSHFFVYLYFGHRTYLLVAKSDDLERAKQLTKCFGTFMEAECEQAELAAAEEMADLKNGYRHWESRYGKFSVKAKLLSRVDGVLQLETKQKDIYAVQIDKLSILDQQYIAQLPDSSP